MTTRNNPNVLMIASMLSENVKVERKGKICWITLMREKRYNAISGEMYRALCSAFDQADDDKDIMMTVITGFGNYYSAGSDFSPAEVQENLLESNDDAYGPYKLWVDRVIKHTKPLIALVNGPCIGIAVTTLALCDAVFASDKATFWCPFTQLGLNPEACSSYTFVNTMGYQKAARMALFAERMTAQEAYEAGLVSKVFPDSIFRTETKKIVEGYSKLGRQSLMVSKRLLRPQATVEKLLTINRQEYETLMEQLQSDETLERLLAKFGKSKL